MLADARARFYAEALRSLDLKDKVVLDLGSGVGSFAVLAALQGARRAYALDINPLVHLAAQLAGANKVGERVTVLCGDALTLEPPERVDVIVCDLRAAHSISGRHLAVLASVRDRWLKPDGLVIPGNERIYAAPWHSDKKRDTLLGVWDRQPVGVDHACLKRWAVNQPHRERITAEMRVGEPRLAFSLDFRSVRQQGFATDLSWTASSDRQVDGLVLWFDSELTPGVVMSGAPGQPPLIYGHFLLPMTERFVLAAGQTLTVHLEAKPLKDDYLWVWRTRVPGTTLAFDQSSFLGEPVAGGAVPR